MTKGPVERHIEALLTSGETIEPKYRFIVTSMILDERLIVERIIESLKQESSDTSSDTSSEPRR